MVLIMSIECTATESIHIEVLLVSAYLKNFCRMSLKPRPEEFKAAPNKQRLEKRKTLARK